jgi:hypothetical protein
MRGTGDENAKWSSVFSHYRIIPTYAGRRSPVKVQVKEILPPEVSDLSCLPCNELPDSFAGVPCAHFTIELTGGLDFDNIQEQLDTRFDWEDVYPPGPPKYLLPPGATIPNE